MDERWADIVAVAVADLTIIVPAPFRLADILHGRTLHIHALSPLHKPRRGHWGEEEEEEERDQGEGDDDEVLGQTDLDDMASQLYSFLSLRLNASIFAPPAVVNGNSTGREGAAASGSDLSLDTGDGRPWTASAGGMIKTVRAAFVQMPLTARPAAQRHTDPPPWAVEIELEPLPDANDLMTPTSQAQRHRKTHIERAHLVFLSSPRRISSTHYPLLIWKAPAPRLGLSGTAGATDGMGEDAASSMHQLTSRALVTHMLGFVARYFDCRLSHLAPLCSLRGRGLETVANGILRSMRAEEYEVQDESRGDDDFGGPAQQHSVDLTYALPLHVAEEDSSDDDNDDTGPRESIRTDRRASDNVNDPRKRRRRDVKPGPAPELNSISLTVPHAVVQSLLHRTPTGAFVAVFLEAYVSCARSSGSVWRSADSVSPFFF